MAAGHSRQLERVAGGTAGVAWMLTWRRAEALLCSSPSLVVRARASASNLQGERE